MINALLKARHLVWLWALFSAMASMAIILDQGGVGVADALFHPNVWVSALTGLVVTAALSPILTAGWMRWYWGGIIGLPTGALIVFCFFFLKPHAWQATRLEAWKSVGLFVAIYPLALIPAALTAGALGALLICEPRDPQGRQE